MFLVEGGKIALCLTDMFVALNYHLIDMFCFNWVTILLHSHLAFTSCLWQLRGKQFTRESIGSTRRYCASATEIKYEGNFVFVLGRIEINIPLLRSPLTHKNRWSNPCYQGRRHPVLFAIWRRRSIQIAKATSESSIHSALGRRLPCGYHSSYLDLPCAPLSRAITPPPPNPWGASRSHRTQQCAPTRQHHWRRSRQRHVTLRTRHHRSLVTKPNMPRLLRPLLFGAGCRWLFFPLYFSLYLFRSGSVVEKKDSR
jgi:hypothetical protein